LINSLIFFIVFAAHEFYVSIMDVDYSKKEHSIQVTKKIFFDDLEHALVLFTKNQELDILAYNQDSLKPILAKYFIKHIFFEVNNTIKEFNYLGQEYLDGSFYCYLEIPEINKIKNIKIKDNLLIDVFKGQENIVYLNINNNKKTIRLREGFEEQKLWFAKQ